MFAATTMDFQLTLMHLLDRAGTVNARSTIVTRASRTEALSTNMKVSPFRL